MIRTAKGQSDRGGPAFGSTDPRRRQATSLFGPDRSNICHPAFSGPAGAVLGILRISVKDASRTRIFGGSTR